jgi:hypothetical protein
MPDLPAKAAEYLEVGTPVRLFVIYEASDEESKKFTATLDHVQDSAYGPLLTYVARGDEETVTRVSEDLRRALEKGNSALYIHIEWREGAFTRTHSPGVMQVLFSTDDPSSAYEPHQVDERTWQCRFTTRLI